MGDQAKNTELIKKSIDDAKSTIDNQRKDIEDKLENYIIKFEIGQKEMKDTIDKDSKNNLAEIQDEINVIKGDILGNNNNTNAIAERISVLHSDLQKLDITQVETAEKIKEVTVLATNIDVYVKSQEEKLRKQKEEDSSIIFARLSKLDSDVDELKRNISEVDGKGNNMTLSIEALTNSFGDKLDDLKTVDDKLDNKIDDLEKMLQQTQEKAKDEVDASISKNNAAVNEFRSEIENKVQNITIQYQDGLDKALEENNLLKNEISKIRDDAHSKNNDLDDKLNTLINDNKNNSAELINIKEANFAQQEKVKFVEALSAKVDNLNEERQKSEALMIERNEELIAKNAATIRDLEKQQNDRLEILEKDNKAGFEKTMEANNNLTIIIDNLKSESDELKEAIQDLNELMQEKEEKAKDEMDSSVTKTNIVINEFKTDIENKIQNITIQHQQKLDKSIAENNGLRREFQNLKDDRTLSDMIEGLKAENDDIKDGIQNLNLIMQQNESKAKDEADATLTKSNTIINEFKTDVENKVQNITIQYQDNIDKVMQENIKLTEEIEKMKDDVETLGDVIESVQDRVNKLDINTSGKFEKVLQEINSYTTNIKMVMEAD